MSWYTDPLVAGKVIGDVLDPFVPRAALLVRYGFKQVSQVSNSCEIKPSAAVDRPDVQIIGSRRRSTNRYTLVMVDPDWPNPDEPTLRQFLHWIVVDIPEGSDATKGIEIVPYTLPQPNIGVHRYVFALFKQNGGSMMGIPRPNALTNFSTRQFASINGLGLPVAAAYFNCQKE